METLRKVIAIVEKSDSGLYKLLSINYDRHGMHRIFSFPPVAAPPPSLDLEPIQHYILDELRFIGYLVELEGCFIWSYNIDYIILPSNGITPPYATRLYLPAVGGENDG